MLFKIIIASQRRVEMIEALLKIFSLEPIGSIQKSASKGMNRDDDQIFGW